MACGFDDPPEDDAQLQRAKDLDPEAWAGDEKGFRERRIKSIAKAIVEELADRRMQRADKRGQSREKGQ
jgi:hypothetical protein